MLKFITLIDIIINTNYRRPDSRDLSERVLNARIVRETPNCKSVLEIIFQSSVPNSPQIRVYTFFLSKKCSEVEDNLVKWHAHYKTESILNIG